MNKQIVEQDKMITLYQQNTRGKNKVWSISVEMYADNTASYTMSWGQEDGKMQESTTYINQGKNIGKSNETTPYDQAISEARSKIEKQRDKGYVENTDTIARSETTGLDIRPMLAYKFEDYADKIEFPLYVQPKLDGCRALAIYNENGFVDLISRKGKSFGEPVQHIIDVLSGWKLKNVVLDGELYNHDVDFQTIVSYTKKKRPESLCVQYHLYDCILSDKDADFKSRNDFLEKFSTIVTRTHPINFVQTKIANNADELTVSYEEFVQDGYEGLMVRSGACKYKIDQRSKELLKMKEFLEEEFRIVGVVSGVGRALGQGTFICVTENGTEFNCRPRGTDDVRKEYLTNANDYIGQMLTVRFFEWTTGNNPVPRFPVGVTVRDYE